MKLRQKLREILNKGHKITIWIKIDTNSIKLEFYKRNKEWCVYKSHIGYCRKLSTSNLTEIIKLIVKVLEHSPKIKIS